IHLSRDHGAAAPAARLGLCRLLCRGGGVCDCRAVRCWSQPRQCRLRTLRTGPGRGRAMSNLALGLVAFPVILVLIFLRVPIGLAMLGVGVFGSWLITGSPVPILAQFKNLTYSTFASSP